MYGFAVELTGSRHITQFKVTTKEKVGNCFFDVVVWYRCLCKRWRPVVVRRCCLRGFRMRWRERYICWLHLTHQFLSSGNSNRFCMHTDVVLCGEKEKKNLFYERKTLERDGHLVSTSSLPTRRMFCYWIFLMVISFPGHRSSPTDSTRMH